MAILDASVLVNGLVRAGIEGQLARTEMRNYTFLTVPAIFGAEATSALRTLVLRGSLDPIRALGAIRQIRSIRLIQYPFEPFISRVWELRNTMTTYDGWYVALAESLGTELVTADQKLAESSGSRAPIRFLGA